KTPQEVIEILSLENEDEEEKKEEVTLKAENSDLPEVLAVTACPTGIAHTYMAADALIKKAKELGVNIKVETNGSTGVKNMLTDEEIKNAKGIIVAADKNVEMARFDGKNVEIVPVKEGIKNPEGLIKNALNQTAPIYKADGKSSGVSNKKEKTGFYKHLMSGVSNMLPFVVGGGILIALSFMFGITASNPSDPNYSPIAKLLNDIGGGNAFFLMVPVMAGFIGMSIADRPGFAPAMVGGLISLNNGGGFLGGLIGGFLGGYTIVLLKKVFNKLPQSFEGLKPVLLYPLFGIFITGALMYGFIVDPIAALNNGVTEFLKSLGTGNLVLLGIVLAAMMATDMGGPINKAAFTFGIMMITAGDYAPHAAVMAGGMVPPLGIALATTFFKNKFTKDEIDAGKTCYIMGLSFITEGAIPFAAADPVRVIPASAIGAAIAGGLSMFFKVQLPAPHGGIFVFPVVTNPMMYLLSIVIGSVVTALILGFIKKPVQE
ncbi:PTS fructose transporter subunit IIC, partial [uncultured Fusobacterium sp.]|uniref:PTS fructose transporter subunit IIC n=2 Tax=Fusobacterium TaxID=848 RepID=UPI0025F089F2